MKKSITAISLALSLLVVIPNRARADWNSPQTRHGHGWLQGRALNTAPWLHFHGPLYNYGPYTTQGHVPMFVKNPWHGGYVPAYPAAYYGYENPVRYPNIIQPYFPAAPMQSLTAPTNLYHAQAQPVATVPMASVPSPSSSSGSEPAAATRRPPVFFGQFRANLRR